MDDDVFDIELRRSGEGEQLKRKGGENNSR